MLDVLSIGVPLLLLVVTVPVFHTKNLLARVECALTETAELKLAVEAYEQANGRLPESAEELGAVARRDYPDGGYFTLEANGVIRIQFSVKKHLTGGSIVQRPEKNAGKLQWRCAVDGDIDQKYLPVRCRADDDN